MMLINGPQEVVALEQWLDISLLIGDEINGGTMETLELGLYGFMEEQENQNRRLLSRIFGRNFGRRRR